MTTVNLTALAEARAKMTPGQYVMADHDDAGPEGSLHVVALQRYEGGDISSSTLVAMMPDAERADDDAAGLVAEHNAAGVLIEVVRTLLEWNHAKVHSDRDEFLRCKSAHNAALAKVSI